MKRIFVLVALVAMAIPGSQARAIGQRLAIDPGLFEEVASGVGRIESYDCRGKKIGQGTGFLIGTRLMMTAKHVVAKGCSGRIVMGGDVYWIKRRVFWRTSTHSRDSDLVDVATLVLRKPAVGRYTFSFAKRLPRVKSTIAAIGFPAGNPMSLSQGRFLGTRKIKGIPTLGVRLHTAQGSSGSALLNDQGEVLGVLQKGYADISDGAVFGINLVSWWPGIEDDLCAAHPSAGVPYCDALADVGEEPQPPPPPPPPPAPPPQPTVAWIEACSIHAWDSAAERCRFNYANTYIAVGAGLPVYCVAEIRDAVGRRLQLDLISYVTGGTSTGDVYTIGTPSFRVWLWANWNTAGGWARPAPAGCRLYLDGANVASVNFTVGP